MRCRRRVRLAFCCEKTASGKDILPTACSDCSENPMGSKVVTQRLHALFVGCREVDAWYLVKSDKVYTALKSLQQTYDFTSIDRCVIESVEADVFKRATALVCKIILLKQFNGILQGHSLFGRH